MLQVFKKLIIKTNPFEIVDITHDIYDQINTCDIKNGLVNLSILHTSCSLIIQENADPTVLKDIFSF